MSSKKYLLKAQNIHEDLELSKIISDDMNAVWEKVGDQEKMYKSFPFSITFESVHKEYDDTTVPNTPFNREKSGIDTIIKYNEE